MFKDRKECFGGGMFRVGRVVGVMLEVVGFVG